MQKLPELTEADRVAFEEQFKKVVHTCMDDPEFMENYDRLRGTSLSKLQSRAPIDIMVDEATGYQEQELLEFFTFVKDRVFGPFLDSVVDAQIQAQAKKNGKK